MENFEEFENIGKIEKVELFHNANENTGLYEWMMVINDYHQLKHLSVYELRRIQQALFETLGEYSPEHHNPVLSEGDND